MALRWNNILCLNCKQITLSEIIVDFLLSKFLKKKILFDYTDTPVGHTLRSQTFCSPQFLPSGHGLPGHFIELPDNESGHG